MKFTVDRKLWERGNPDNTFMLHPKTGKMYIMGFFGLACGYTKEEISGACVPQECAESSKRNLWPQWVGESRTCKIRVGWNKYKTIVKFDESDEIYQLIYTNDSECITESNRERTIAKIFSRHGIIVEFI